MEPLVRLDRFFTTSCVVRGQRVWRDVFAGSLYGLPTGRINEIVARNRALFPPDFAFRAPWSELESVPIELCEVMREEWGGTRHPAQYFTEEGALMLANVLRTPAAMEDRIQLVRAFVKLRRQFAPILPARALLRKGR